MKRLLTGWLVLALLFLAGCSTPAPRRREPTVALSGWGEFVGSRDLDAWIKTATTSAPFVVAAERAVRVEAAGETAVRAGRRPSLGVEADVRTGRKKTEMTDGEERDVEPVAGRASAAWDLDIFGRVRAEIGAARFAELAARHRLRDREVGFAADVADTYVRGLLWNDRVRLRTEAVTAQDAMMAYVQARVRAGLALPAELERLDAARQVAVQQQLRSEQALAEMDVQWRYLVSEGQVPSLRTLGGITPGRLPAIPEETAVHAYAVNRPDVRAAHELWQEATMKARAAARDRLPTVSAVARVEGEGPSPVEEPEVWTVWAGARLSLPVLAPGRRATARVQQRRAELQESLFEETTALAIRDLRLAYTRRVHSERIWRAAQVSADRLQERFRSVQRQFEEGRVPVPEVERARLVWLAAHEAALAGYAEVLRSHIDLTRACGGVTGGSS